MGGGTAVDHTWDAIVVGAGQAGCAAAYDLAARGQRVLILDRQHLPRIKACAGGVTVKALNLLRFSIAPVVRCVVRDIALSTDGLAPRRIGGSAPMLVTTVRSELDRFCLDRAIEQGARFAACGDDRITGVEQGERAVSLRLASGKSLAARFVVAADGANSTIRRLLGLGQVRRAFALEGHVPMDCAKARPLAFDFAAVPGGYGWVFPKGDHLNVGIYTQDPAVALSKDALRGYARTATGNEVLDGIVGAPLGVDGHRAVRAQGRVLFAGDAAGACERLLGEGIHNAIRSGQAAAAAILGAHDGPERAARLLHMESASLHRDVAACARGAHAFYGKRRLRQAAVGLRPVTAAFRDGFAAGMTFRDIAIAAPFYPLFAIRPVETVVHHESGMARQPQ